VPENAPKKAWVPSEDIGTDWRSAPLDFDDSTWTGGGFSTSTLAFDGVDDYADFGPIPVQRLTHRRLLDVSENPQDADSVDKQPETV
jgi:hypothetical protein